jgi:NAD(P)H-nitrite reductase large subunit
VVPHFTCSQCPALIWHHRGEVYGLVAPLWEQAAVLADHITGADLGAAYHGSRLATKLKVAGVDVAAMGLKEPERPDDEDGAEHAGSRMALASLLKMMWTSSTSTSETPGSSTTGCTPISSGTTLSRWCHSSPVASPPRRIADVAERYQIPMIKVTGGQRIDLLGVRKEDLPQVWADLDMPSGYAYGKSFRTVKTCVGSDFCRFGLGDSTQLGIDIEHRYRGLESPAKMKLAVSGCPVTARSPMSRMWASLRSKVVGGRST